MTARVLFTLGAMGVVVWIASGIPGWFDAVSPFVGDVLDALPRHIQDPHRYIWIATALMVLEALLPFIPLGPLVAANAMFFGPVVGLVASWAGTLVGAAFCFGVGRTLTNGLLAPRLHEAAAGTVPNLLERNSFHLLVVARFVPGVNCVVSYLAGIAGVPFGVFAVASAVGLLPWVSLYTLLAHNLLEVRSFGWWVIFVLAWLLIYRAGVRLAPVLHAPPEAESK